MLPARSLDSKVELPDGDVPAALKASSAAEVELGLKGLVDGVGREVLEARLWDGIVPMVPTGEIRDGNVPARPRRAGLLTPVSVRGTRSGKPSWLGDSGISKSGVDVPLVGGPQIFKDTPAGVCNSLVRLGNNLDVCS